MNLRVSFEVNHDHAVVASLDIFVLGLTKALTIRDTRGIREKSERGLARWACPPASNCMVFARNGDRPTADRSCVGGGRFHSPRLRPNGRRKEERKEGRKEGRKGFFLRSLLLPIQLLTDAEAYLPLSVRSVGRGRSIGP